MKYEIGIIGGKSNLFNRFCKLSLKNSSYNFVTYGRNECDVSLDLNSDLSVDYLTSIIGSQSQISCFMIFAGVSKPDKCADNPWLSYKVNVINLIKLISICLELKKEIIFLSSDAVFEAASKPINENNKLEPLSAYGIQKAAIENYFKDHKNFKSLRLSYVLCRDDFLLDKSMYLEKCGIYRNFMRNVIVEDDLYKVLDEYISNFQQHPECLNIAGLECLSKFDIGLEVAKAYKFPKPRACDASDDFFANRARKINMQSLYLSDVLSRFPRNVPEWLTQLKS
jgi:dTDP-4-dehydrorhamnose reductase